MTWPSASTMRPARVVSVMPKLTPRARKASTECSISRAISGSSQVRKASSAGGRFATGHRRRIADDLGRLCCRRPGHQNLRLGQQQPVSAVDGGFGGDGFITRRRLHRAEPRARAHQQDRGDDGEAEDAQRQCEGGDLVTIEQSEGSDERRQRSWSRVSAAASLAVAAACGSSAPNRLRRRCAMRPLADEPHSSPRSGSCPACPLAPSPHSWRRATPGSRAERGSASLLSRTAARIKPL